MTVKRLDDYFCNIYNIFNFFYIYFYIKYYVNIKKILTLKQFFIKNTYYLFY